MGTPFLTLKVFQVKESSRLPSVTSPGCADVHSMMKNLEVGMPTFSKTPRDEEGGESLFLSRNRKLCDLWLRVLAMGYYVLSMVGLDHGLLICGKPAIIGPNSFLNSVLI